MNPKLLQQLDSGQREMSMKAKLIYVSPMVTSFG